MSSTLGLQGLGFVGVLVGTCRVVSQGAPGKAERSLLFLVTTVRELGLALAGTRGEPCLEASVLEAAFQVPIPSNLECCNMRLLSCVMCPSDLSR